MSQSPMLTVGLLGGVASGKSEVARQFAQFGAGVLDADRAGHEALRLPPVRRAVAERWGATVLGADGAVDRRKLAAVVFAPPPDGPRERAYLEQLTHPEIARCLETQAQGYRVAGKPMCVLDAALLLEAGWDRLCERLIFVEVPRTIRFQRALARGWSEAEFAAREAAQWPVDEKRRRADAVIDNSGPQELTQAQVVQLWNDWGLSPFRDATDWEQSGDLSSRKGDCPP